MGQWDFLFWFVLGLFEDLSLGFCLLSLLLALIRLIKITSTALRFIVASPAVDSALVSTADRVMLTSFNSCHVNSFGTKLDEGWVADVFLVANTELAVIVQAPGKQLVRFIFVKRCVSTTKHIDRIFSSTGFNPQC